MFRALTRLLRRGAVDPAQLLLSLCGVPTLARAAPAGRALTPPAVPPRPRPRPRCRRTAQEEDDAAVVRLEARHAEYNEARFGGELRPIRIDVSRRLRKRLGYYRLAVPGKPALIAVSRRHLRRHGWEEACHTLLHEMVHQWQEQTGRAVDHGAQFRAKARAVGAVPRARRPVGGDRAAGAQQAAGDPRTDAATGHRGVRQAARDDAPPRGRGPGRRREERGEGEGGEGATRATVTVEIGSRHM